MLAAIILVASPILWLLMIFYIVRLEKRLSAFNVNHCWKHGYMWRTPIDAPPTPCKFCLAGDA